MAFRIVAVLCVLAVFAQASQLSSVGQGSTVGSRTLGVVPLGPGPVSAGSPGRYRPVIGSALPQAKRPVTAPGSVVPAPAGATRRVSGSRHQSALPAAAARPQATGSYPRAAAAPAIGSRPRQTVGPVSPIRQPQGAYGNQKPKPY